MKNLHYIISILCIIPSLYAQHFNGGIGDGHANITHISNNIYVGGIGDGYSDSMFIETQSIFTGGFTDGYASSLYTETQSIFAGGFADGYASSLYTETQSIFAGGIGDGFSSSLYDLNPLCSNNATKWEFGAWTNGVPDATTQVIIDGYYDTSVDGNIDACSCKLANFTILNIASNSYVSIVNDIVNTVDASVTIAPQGSFVQINNDATVTGTGFYSTEIQTTELIDLNRFTYFSSPSKNQDLTAFTNWANMNKLARFNDATQTWYYAPSSQVMPQAVGYAIQPSPNNIFPLVANTFFNGAFNNGEISIDLAYTAGGIDDDNTLAGNPYPSAIDATMLLNNNPGANAFYFWEHNSTFINDEYTGDDYAVWNNSGGIAANTGSTIPTGYIASGQGFFVEATAPDAKLIFDNSIRVTDHNDDFKIVNDEDRNRIWLNLTNNNGLFNQILLNFTQDGTTEFDAKLDASRYVTENPISFYSNGLNNEQFAIQALPVLTEEEIIPLGFNVNNESVNSLKISVDGLENLEDTNIYLRDNLLNITHNIKNSNYEFTTTEGTFNHRFELLFNRDALSLENDVLNQEGLIITNYSENEIMVKTRKGSIISKLKIYDVLGKVIVDLTPQKSSVKIPTNINQGTLLLVKAKLVGGSVQNAKFIKL